MAAAIGYPPEPNASEGAHQRYEIKRLKYLKAYNALLFIRLMQVQDALPGGRGGAKGSRGRGFALPSSSKALQN
ncbi:hypothetical protein [uncultured Gimesia sp.]|uniref:hypothetical protein n=1 Tax=uncultured Gimesia sp. TaxID=1678688 RepID=UPI0030DC8C88